MIRIKYKIEFYQKLNGVVPFNEWLNSIDVKLKARIQARLIRFEAGNLGDHKRIELNIFEARFFFGAGYRIYFGKKNETIIILLCGGDKKSQKKDIALAKRYLNDYLEK